MSATRSSRALAYWRSTLQHAPARLDLPVDARPSGRLTPRFAVASAQIPATVPSLQLERCSPHTARRMVLTSLVALLIARLTGADDLLLATPLERPRSGSTATLASLVRRCGLLRIDLSGNPRFSELAGRVHERHRQAHRHRSIAFSRLTALLRQGGALLRDARLQVLVSNAGVPLDGKRLAASRGRRGRVVQSYPDLAFQVDARGSAVDLHVAYCERLFTRERIDEIIGQYAALLAQVALYPHRRISRLSLVTPSACVPNPRRRLGSTWEGSIPALLGAHAAAEPDRIAVVDANGPLTYRALDRETNDIANQLVSGGVRDGDVVVVEGSRCGQLAVAVLGVMKAGACFLILDPAYPAARLAQYLALAKPTACIRLAEAGAVDPALEAAPERSAIRCHLTIGRTTGARTDSGLDCPERMDNLRPGTAACVSFTSGSSGTPKGVIGLHGSLSHFTPWLSQTFALTGTDRFGMLSGLAHDPLQRDIFTPLQLGARVCAPAPDEYADPRRLVDWIRRHEITVAHLTPGLARQITDHADGGRLPSLRRVFVVGDVLTHRDVQRLREVAPDATYVTFYGATETQRAVAYHVASADTRIGRGHLTGGSDNLPIGRGMPDVQLLVVNTGSQLAGVGELGEICFRSPHLAKG